MVIVGSEKVLSDVTGAEIEHPYRIGVLFDNEIWVVEVDRNDLKNELSGLSVYDALAKGRDAKEFTRNPRGSLNSDLHREAREWAKAQGLEVGDRGMVGKPILDLYMQTHGIKSVEGVIERES